MNEMGGTYYVNVPDNNVPPTPQTITYQQPPPSYWNQQPIQFYQNTQPSNPTPPQRFPVHPSNQTNYISSYPQNYLPPQNQPPPPPNPEVLPVYPHQSMQLVYQTQPSQSNPVVYPNQPNIVYTQNPIYPSPVYPTQNLPQYPQNTSTPNSCTSSVSHTQFTHIQENNHQNAVMHLTQNMAQMSFAQNHTHPNFLVNKMTPPHFDVRQKTCTPKSNKFNAPKGFMLGSSQSSTGTNSPAATVVAGYCPQNSGMYRTPPETPPNQYNFGPGFHMPQMLFRQVSNLCWCEA